MKPVVFRILLLWLLLARFVFGEAMLQYFNTSWAELTRKMPELAEAGYSSLWLPPPTKTPSAMPAVRGSDAMPSSSASGIG